MIMFLVSINEFSLYFLLLCYLLVYHRYTNANIVRLRVGTQKKNTFHTTEPPIVESTYVIFPLDTTQHSLSSRLGR